MPRQASLFLLGLQTRTEIILTQLVDSLELCAPDCGVYFICIFPQISQMKCKTFEQIKKIYNKIEIQMFFIHFFVNSNKF